MAEELHRGDGEAGAGPPATTTVEPGALSRLLAELVRAPEDEPPSAGPAPGAVLGRFELRRQLGAGGFGVVWEARDRELDRLVAFKLVRPGAQASLRGEALRREAEAAARLSHDNIVALHDVGTSDHGPFLVLELLKGQTLAERLAQRPLDPPEALRVFREIVRGVAHAHAEGVVHRDLKPGNVFRCADGRVKVLDFGLAHAFGRRRQSGGTPAYMAPEQWREAPEDERTDVFALGVMLFQLLSGGLPFRDEREAVSAQRAPTLEVPAAPGLGALVARMLEKDPVKRPRDAGEVLAALETAHRDLDASAASLPVRTRRRPRLRLAGLMALGAALGALAALGSLWARRAAPPGDGRLRVAVADIVNETGEKELDVLSGLLVTSLEQSRRLAVLTQARVLDLAAQAGRPGLARVDETVGREVGREQGVAALLLPAIRKLGATYAVEMRAIDPAQDRHLFTVSDRASSKEALLDLLDHLSEKARLQLNEDPGEVEKSRVQLGAAMTRSLEAYQHYVAGLDARYRGLQAAALQEQFRALELDPRFAAAHLQVADLYERYGRAELSARHLDAAAVDLDRMPEKERTLIQINLHNRGRRTLTREALLRLADATEARFPDDVRLLSSTAAALDGLGQADRARAVRLRRLEVMPDYHYAAQLWGKANAETLAVARRAAVLRPNAWTLFQLGEALDEAGATVEALAAARESLRLNQGQSGLSAWNACQTLVNHGLTRECLPHLERFVTAGLNEFERDQARDRIMRLLLVMGRVGEALRLAGEGRRLDQRALHAIGRFPQDAPEALAHVRRRASGQATQRNDLAWFGDLPAAAAVDATLPAAERDGGADAWYQALVAAGQGRHGEAARYYRAEVQRAEGERDANYPARYKLAEVLLAAGKPAEAAAVEAPPWPSSPLGSEEIDLASNYPRLLTVRARAFEALGRKADAVKEADILLEFWKDADADLPLLVEAKARRARLAAR